MTEDQMHLFQLRCRERWNFSGDQEYIDWLYRLPAGELRTFTSTDYSGVRAVDMDPVRALRVLHCVEQPALADSYYLFGVCMSQHTWFEILKFTPEEQVAHILRWGRHKDNPWI